VGWKLLGVLLLSHTIHFVTVFALTIQTHGRNVSARGGSALVIMVGVAFYAATGGALLVRRTPSGARTLPQVGGDAALSLLIGLAFLVTYVGGVGRLPTYALMAALVGGAMLVFVFAVAMRVVRQSAALRRS
jgi:hypothetical protein